MVRSFLSLQTLLTRFLHYLKLFRTPTIVWASLGADLRIFYRLMGIFAFPLPQLHSNHTGLFISHRNTLLLQIPRFSTRLWWVFLLLWTLFTKSSLSLSTLRSCFFSSFRPVPGWFYMSNIMPQHHLLIGAKPGELSSFLCSLPSPITPRSSSLFTQGYLLYFVWRLVVHCRLHATYMSQHCRYTNKVILLSPHRGERYVKK